MLIFSTLSPKKKMKQAEQLEVEWNAMQMEDEANPWAGLGTERGKPGGDAIDPEEAPNCGSRSTETGTGSTPCQNLPHEKERPTENVAGRKWRLPQGCSEPMPQQAEIRTADEVLTILAEPALENEQIHKAMEAMGVAQNLKKEEKVRVGQAQDHDKGFWRDCRRRKCATRGAASPETWPQLGMCGT